MLIYNFSREIGTLTDSEAARESPNEPGVHLIPAYATPHAAPAVQAGNVAAYLSDDGSVPSDYRNGAWREVLDQRGAYYRTSNGEPVSFEEIGVWAADRGLTALVPPENAKWTGKKWGIDKERVKALNNASLRAKIAAIEQTEQPAAQRMFALEGDASAMRDVQAKIDALLAQIQQ